jgi:hypothetical protein
MEAEVGEEKNRNYVECASKTIPLVSPVQSFHVFLCLCVCAEVNPKDPQQLEKHTSTNTSEWIKRNGESDHFNPPLVQQGWLCFQG